MAKNTRNNSNTRTRNTKAAVVESTFTLEKMSARPVVMDDLTLNANYRKGDVYVGAWTTHIVEQMGNLKVGKAVHFSQQSGRAVAKMLRGNGFEVRWVENAQNMWLVIDVEGERQYLLTNWSPTKAAVAGRPTYERSIRRVEFTG